MSEHSGLSNLQLLFANSSVSYTGNELIFTLNKAISLNTNRDISRFLEADYHSNTSVFEHECTFQGSFDWSSKKIVLHRQLFLETSGLLVFVDVRDLLSSESRLPAKEQLCYIASEAPNGPFIWGGENKLYTSVTVYLKLKSLILSLSDYQKSDQEYIFLNENGSKTKVVVGSERAIAETDLAQKVLDLASDYEDRGSTGGEFRQIVKRAFCETLALNHSNELGIVADHFLDFYGEVMKSYHIFLGNFSFSRVKSSFLSERQKYTELVDKNLDNILKVVYTIPLGVGLTLVLKLSGSSPFFETLTSFVSLSLFLLVGCILVVHNLETLKLNEIQIEAQKVEIKTRLTYEDFDLYEAEFHSTFDGFKKKIQLTRVLSLILVACMVILFLVFLVKTIGFNPTIKGFMVSILEIFDRSDLTRWLSEFIRFLY